MRSMTGAPRQNALISTAALAEELEGERPPILLDVRWSAAGPGHADYLAAHLPGAIFLNLDTELAAPPSLPPAHGRHPLPEPGALEAVWRAAGISGGTPVVVYDTANSSIAARAWWLLRWSGHEDVRVLDGGIAAWTRDALPTETGPVTVPEPGWMSVRPGGMPVALIDEVASAATGQVVVLDARAADRYRGESESLDPVAGHIPGAVSLPLTELLSSESTFLPPQHLRERFATALTDGADRPVIASCGSGVTACHLILAAEMAGFSVALFPGSFSGWLGAGRPVATGDRAVPAVD